MKRLVPFLYLLMLSLSFNAAGMSDPQLDTSGDEVRSGDPFEGEIRFQVRDLNSAAAPLRTYTILAAPDRIWMESSHSHRIASGLDANRFLVRADHSDLTFLNSRDEALQMTREELEGFVGLYRQMRGNNHAGGVGFDWENRTELTGRTRTVQGYRVEEIRVQSDKPGYVVSAWLTEEIRMEWGLLEEAWRQSLSALFQTDLPVELFINRRSFPLRIEYIEDGQIVTTAEANRVERGRPASDRVDLPEGTKKLNMGDVMTRMIMGRR